MDAARELGVARSSAHRLLQALVYRDFLILGDDHVYLPGPAMAAEPEPNGGNRRLREIATPAMERLAAAVGDSTNLMIRVADSVRFLKSIPVPGSTYDRRGMIVPARYSAGGKAALALLPDGELATMYRSPTARVRLGAGDFDRLMVDIAGARRRDFALARGEFERSVSAIGTSLRDAAGATLGAITISVRGSGPTDAMVLARFADRLHEAKAAIESEWSYAAPPTGSAATIG